MSSKFVKCKYCNLLDKKDNEEIVLDCNEENQVMKSYIHIKCKKKMLEEGSSKAELYETIKDIYRLQTSTEIPSFIFSKLTEIRNGTYNVNDTKTNTEYNYKIINYAFKLCRSQIEYSLEHIDWECNIKVKDPIDRQVLIKKNQILYGISIVKSKLPYIYRNYIRKRTKEILKKQQPIEETVEINKEIIFEEKKNNKKFDWL